MKYDPEIGVFGMDVSVSLQRPGWRVSRRANRPRPVPRRHRVSRAEGIQFMKDRFKVEVVEGSGLRISAGRKAVSGVAASGPLSDATDSISVAKVSVRSHMSSASGSTVEAI